MYRKVKIDTGTMIVSTLVMIGILVGLFYLVGGIMKLLTWAAPGLLIIALLFDYKTVLNHGKMLIDLVKRKPLIGIGAILLNIVLFPLVFAYLLARAYMTKKLKDAGAEFEKRQQGEYIDYEIVEEKPLKIQQTRKRPQQRQRPSSNEYDQMFD